MSFYHWHPYESVASKRAKAQRELAKLKKKSKTIEPVTIEGRTIAKSFWGKSWCENLERYSDFAYRLPRGRSYVRNGAVLDLRISKGKVAATVSGSELYKVKVEVAPLAASHWRAICGDCAGSIDSLIELLQGRFEKSVMTRVTRAGDGLFPAPPEIELACSCPDWADMCKHVAAALYGVGARLDAEPRLLFLLRGVDENELIVGASRDLSLPKARPGAAVLNDGDVAALFGLEMADADAERPLDAAPAPRQEATAANAKRARRGATPAPPSREKALAGSRAESRPHLQRRKALKAKASRAAATALKDARAVRTMSKGGA